MIIFQAVIKAHLEDAMNILSVFSKAQALWEEYFCNEWVGGDFLEWSLEASDEWL